MRTSSILLQIIIILVFFLFKFVVFKFAAVPPLNRTRPEPFASSGHHHGFSFGLVPPRRRPQHGPTSPLQGSLGPFQSDVVQHQSRSRQRQQIQSLVGHRQRKPWLCRPPLLIVSSHRTTCAVAAAGGTLNSTTTSASASKRSSLYSSCSCRRKRPAAAMPLGNISVLRRRQHHHHCCSQAIIDEKRHHTDAFECYDGSDRRHRRSQS